MTYFVLRLICFISFSAAFFQTSFAANKTIKIDVEDAAAPWSSKDGTGFANEVVVASFKKMGLDVSLVVVPYARCKHDVSTGDSVACFSMSADSELKNKVKFSDVPLFGCHADYYYNSKNELSVKKEWQIPKGKVVGVVNGYEYPDSVKTLANEGIILEAGINEVANLQKLALGRLDFVIVNHNAIKPSSDTIAEAGVTDKVKFAFRGGLLKSYIGFSTKHPDGDWARKQFNMGFAKLRSSGGLLEIEKRWIHKLEIRTPANLKISK